jgi:hypothetical protein
MHAHDLGQHESLHLVPSSVAGSLTAVAQRSKSSTPWHACILRLRLICAAVINAYWEEAFKNQKQFPEEIKQSPEETKHAPQHSPLAALNCEGPSSVAGHQRLMAQRSKSRTPVDPCTSLESAQHSTLRSPLESSLRHQSCGSLRTLPS